MIKKMMELAEIRHLNINVIIYDSKFHKMEEIYSHESIKLEHINEQMEELKHEQP